MDVIRERKDWSLFPSPPPSPSVSFPSCMVTAESRTKKKKKKFECVNTHQPTGCFFVLFFWLLPEPRRRVYETMSPMRHHPRVCVTKK